MRNFGFVAIAALCAASLPAAAQSQDVASAVGAETRSEQAKAQDESRQPATVLEFAEVKKGDVVADILAGNGYFSEMISSLVGRDGKVYIVNPSGFHDPAVWAAHQASRKNYRLLVGDPKALVLAPGSVDMIFTHMVFHDLFWESEQFNYPRLDVPYVLANWRAALKDGGTVVIVDHHGPKGDTREVVDRLHRIDRDAALATMEKAGFELVAESDTLVNPDDDINVLVFDEAVRGKTSRFMMKFKKK